MFGQGRLFVFDWLLGNYSTTPTHPKVRCFDWLNTGDALVRVSRVQQER